MRGAAVLRKIRVGMALVVFVLLLLPFFGEERITTLFSELLLRLQFIPSFLRFLAEPAALLGLTWAAILLITLCFGRVYCSLICPLGILQDLAGRLLRKTGVRKRYPYHRRFHHLQLVLLFLAAVTVLLGFNSLLNVLDPFSIFSRIVVHLFTAMAVFCNNLLVSVLELFDVYDISMKKHHQIPLPVFLLTVIFFLAIILVSGFSGRLYCNSICPVGALLGLLGRFSLWRVRIDKRKCAACGQCEKICKSDSIVSGIGEIEQGRCVKCFNCLAVCRLSAISYGMTVAGSAGNLPAASRRRAITSVVGAIVYFCSAGPLFSFPERALRYMENEPITPPGSVNVKHFTSRCVGCHLCVAGCPTRTLTPSLKSYGYTGVLQPVMDYRKGHCLLSCTYCGSVCPTGAITPLSEARKRVTRIGRVRLKKELCIVHVRKIHCGACGEACPTNAIFPAKKGSVAFPEINNNYCIGCGACELACPTAPKSIVVEANRVHEIAEIYAPPRLPEPEVDLKGDFPF